MTSLLDPLKYAVSDSWSFVVTRPSVMRLMATRAPDGAPIPNRASRRADLYTAPLIKAWEVFLQCQARETSLVEVDLGCCLPEHVSQVTGWYRNRLSHRRSRWTPARRGTTRVYDGEMIWDAAWVLAHLEISAGQTMLDVGAENSFMPIYCAWAGADVNVVDMWHGSYGEAFENNVLQKCLHGKFAIRVRGNGAHVARVAYQKGDAAQLEFDDESFDRVICLSTIEHVVNDSAAIREMGRVLKPGGVLALTTVIGPAWQQRSDTPHHKTADGSWTGDLDRIYDQEALFSRLIEPSGLRLMGPSNFEVDWRRLRDYQMPGARSEHPSVALFLTK